jgi:hypothetical protein
MIKIIGIKIKPSLGWSHFNSIKCPLSIILFIDYQVGDP